MLDGEVLAENFPVTYFFYFKINHLSLSPRSKGTGLMALGIHQVCGANRDAGASPQAFPRRSVGTRVKFTPDFFDFS
jgi:hypothetical protein